MNEIRQNTKGNDLIRLILCREKNTCDEVHALPEKPGKCSLQMKRSKAQRLCPVGVVCGFMQADKMGFDRE